LREDERVTTRIEPLLERLQRSPTVPDDDRHEVLDVVRAAADEAEALAARERVYRETIRQGNQDFERKVTELSLLRRIGDLIAGSLKMDDLLDRVLDVLVQELRVDTSSVLVRDEATGELQPAADRAAAHPGASSEEARPLLRLGEDMGGWIAESRDPLVVNDISRDVRFRHAAERDGLRGALIAVPLIAEGRVIGVLNLSSVTAGFFDPHHAHILEIVASQIAGALLGQRLYRELRGLSGRLEEEVSQRTAELHARTADLRRKNEQVTQLYYSLERAQKELEQRNRRLVEALTFNDNIVETVNVGISVVNHEGRVVTWNRAMESVTGGVLSKENVLGRQIDELSPEVRERFALGAVLIGALESEEPVTLHGHVAELGDGRRRDLNIHHLPVSIANDGNVQVITVIEDVTDNVALHEQKVRSERLAAINETMVSVNHEVNNPLAVILGYAQILLRKLRTAGEEGSTERWVEEARRDLERIEAESLRVREITRKLSSLVEPVVTAYPAGEGVRMVDVSQSR